MHTTTRTAFDVTFPRVLGRLDYSDRLSEADYSEVTVDSRKMIHWYFRVMYDGARYERYVQSEENRRRPNCLMACNFSNARKVRARGWKTAWIRPVIDRPCPWLERIPLEADLLTSDAHDADAIAALEALNEFRGLRVANATKLLYQKRPRLIPILDEFARCAFDIPWFHGTACRPAYLLGFQRVRELATHSGNSRALDHLEDWLRTSPEITNGLVLSRLRLLDVLAWGIVRQSRDQLAAHPVAE